MLRRIIGPEILANDGSFGPHTNGFGFNVGCMPGQAVVIEASSNLTNWAPLATNLLGTDPLYFSDPASTNLSQRFYRAVLVP